MAAMAEVLTPALEDALEAHAAVADRFRTDANHTPPGAHRQELERRVTEAQSHLERIEDRVREVRPSRGLLSAAAQVTRFGARGLVRVTLLPLETGMSAVAEMMRGQGAPDDRRLLEITEAEYGAAARALATCRVAKDIAEQVNDQETADLLAALRREDEQLLETLEGELIRHARAVAAATNGHHPRRAGTAEERTPLAEVVRPVRAAVFLLGAATRRTARRVRDTAEGVWRELPDAARMAQEARGALTRAQELPVPGFSRLGITEIRHRLRGLSQTELTRIEGYERAHAGRPDVLKAVEDLREAEPWNGYDAMSPEEIKTHLHDVDDSVVQQELAYERRHRHRDAVIDAAEARLRVTAEATHKAPDEIRGEAGREEDLPIAGYGRLGITEIQQRLSGLSRTDLTVVQGYERVHQNRRAVLDAIDRLRGAEPWAGYDAMDPDEIIDRLGGAPAGVARQVMEYELTHQQRRRIMAAALRHIPM
ncbi:hypothetical protein ABB07_07140 [Streptomyces incarnatus]|uniref:CHAD domain-containing protein n=1 Tax=Streptomyces incarnatus TaxID=665007 RepID=A0ABM5TFU1_9ACTN|nr:hypothetical protein [Streptomyces incarnatus]AKJ09800.1 hypothetical protein ABB07_07140 [Streptomyces incarnatus]